MRIPNEGEWLEDGVRVIARSRETGQMVEGTLSCTVNGPFTMSPSADYWNVRPLLVQRETAVMAVIVCTVRVMCFPTCGKE